MPKKIDDEDYQILLDAFREAGEYYFANAKTKERHPETLRSESGFGKDSRSFQRIF